jgi:hypothetical protein
MESASSYFVRGIKQMCFGTSKYVLVDQFPKSSIIPSVEVAPKDLVIDCPTTTNAKPILNSAQNVFLYY